MLLYADDAKCYRVIKDHSDAEQLQQGLDLLHRTSTSAQEFGGAAFVFPSIIRKKKNPVEVVYQLGDECLKSSSCQKDLGLMANSTR